MTLPKHKSKGGKGGSYYRMFRAFTFVVCFLATGCASDTYKEPDFGETGHAMVSAARTDVHLLGVDGNRVINTDAVKVAPGPHVFHVEMKNRGFLAMDSHAIIAIDAQASRRYTIDAVLLPNPHLFLVWVVDQDSGDVLAGTTPEEVINSQ